MEKPFQLNIVTPDRAFFSGDVQSLVVNTTSGEMGILYHTLPLVAVLKAGRMRIKKNGRWMEAIGSAGFVSVMRDKVTVLTQSCVWPYETENEESNEHALSDDERKAASMHEYKMAKAQLSAQFAKLQNKNRRE